MKISLILLAAGEGRRFGGGKLLYPVEGISLYRRAAELALRSGCETLAAVYSDRVIGAALAELGFITVLNDAPSLGISRSIRLGMEAGGDADGWLFLVCDQPWLRPETVRRIVCRFRDGNRGIVAAAENGRAGNPVLFASRYREELLALQGDVGGRAVLRRYAEDAALVEVSSPEELMDLDVRPLADGASL